MPSTQDDAAADRLSKLLDVAISSLDRDPSGESALLALQEASTVADSLAPKRSTRAPRHAGTIVKVQMPLNSLTADALIYDENRKHQVFVPQTTYLRRKMAGEAKVFFYAEWNGDFWVLGSPAAWQRW